MHRAYEQGVPAPPVHAARNRQLFECRVHDAGQELRRALAGLAADEEQKRPLALREPLERGDVDAATLGEGQRGARGSAGGVEGRRERRSLALQVLFGLARGEALHPHGEAPRRGVTGELTVRELRLVEPGGESRNQRLLQRQQRPGRQLLGADLQEEVVMLDLHAALTREAASAARRSGKPSASRLS